MYKGFWRTEIIRPALERPERLEIERRADAFLESRAKREGRIVMVTACTGLGVLGWVLFAIWGLL